MTIFVDQEKPKLAWVEWRLFEIIGRDDGGYQRDEVGPLIERLVAEWDWRKCGALIASPSLASVSRYNLLDGRQRWTAMGRLGITEVPTFIVSDSPVDVAEEAKDFTQINTVRRNLTRYDKHVAAVVAVEPSALAVNAAMDAVGLRLAPGRGGIGSVQSTHVVAAIAAVYEVCGMGGTQHLIDVLRIICDAWHNDPAGLVSEMIRGMSKFLRSFPDVSQRDMIDRFGRANPIRIVEDAHAVMFGPSAKADVPTKVAFALVQVFNRGRRTARLDSQQVLRRASPLYPRGAERF